VSHFNASRKGSIVRMLAAGLLGTTLPGSAALAGNATHGQPQFTGSKSGEASSERSAAVKAPARKPLRKPDGSGNFIYAIINNIRAQSEEICTRYGSPSDCLQEAEVCLTMRDAEDNQVRMCLNTVPGSDDRADAQKARLRR
jgi:hypothetical protein